MTEPIFPHVNVQLVGEDGNAFSILGRVSKAMRTAGIPKEKIDEFYKEATSGDYSYLLVTVMKWVNVDQEEDEEYLDEEFEDEVCEYCGRSWDDCMCNICDECGEELEDNGDCPNCDYEE